MRMKTIITLFVSLIILQACNPSPSPVGSIEFIKNGIMQFNKSLTVGQAFDGWSECKDRNWTTLKTDNGQQIVQFDCEIKDAAEFMQRAKSILSNKKSFDSFKHFELSKVITSCQWVINEDKTFQVSAMGTLWQWADGKSTLLKGDTSMLQSVYSNKRTFNPTDLEGLDSLSINRIVTKYEQLAQRLYAIAK